MRITLKEEVWEEGTFTYHDGEKARVRYKLKEKLTARQCECCGKVFGVPGGQYEDCKVILTMDKDHPSHCDYIWLSICSVECGLKLAQGAWRQTTFDPMDDDGSHPFVTIGANVKTYKLNVRTDLISRAKLIERWEASGKKPQLISWKPDSHTAEKGGAVSITAGNSPAAVQIERQN